jgi:hypothetical protein
MIPIVASLLGTLAQNGLGLLSSAIQAKGKEVVEKHAWGQDSRRTYPRRCQQASPTSV